MCSISNAIAVGAAVIIVAFVATWYSGRRRETFATAPEVYQAARALFERNGSATYSDYRVAVPGADPVQFADVRGLWKNGQLTQEAVARVL